MSEKTFITMHPRAIDPDYTGGSEMVRVPLEMAVASEALVEERHAICKGCDKLQDGRCAECGCPIPGRLKLTTSVCPLGKWAAAPSEELVASIPNLPPAQALAAPLSSPGISDMAKSFFSSAAKFVAAGLPRTPLEQLQTRLDTCKACEYWNAEGFGGTGSCRQCGCSTQVKLRMATSECPMGYWQAVPPFVEGAPKTGG